MVWFMWNIFPTHVYVPQFPASYSPRDRLREENFRRGKTSLGKPGFEFNSFKKNLNMA